MRGMLLANHGVFRAGRTQGTALDIRAHVGTSTSPNSATNLLNFTEQFDNAYWFKQAITVAANNTTAPDGTLTADRFTATSSNSAVAAFDRPVTNGATYTFSVWMRADTPRDIVLSCFQLSTLTVWAQGNFSVTSTWQRFSVTGVAVGSLGHFQFSGLTNGAQIHAWGAQLEVGSVATSYVPVPFSSASRAVTGVGFTPKAVLPFGSLGNVDGPGGSLWLSYGAGTASSQASVGVTATGNQTTSVTDRRHTNNQVMSSLSIGGQVASRSSLDSDGFTLNWSTVLTTERILNHICLGGADLEVSLTQHQMNATNAAQSFAHGLSGAPTGLMFFSALNATSPANTSTILDMSFGAWASSGQFGASVFSSNGVTTTSTRRALYDNHVIGDLASTLQRSMAVSSVDATNVNVTYPGTTSSAQAFFWILAIRGARCQVGTFDCNGSTSPLTINTPGITPRLFMPVFVPGGVDNVGTVQNGLELTIGASDGTRNVSCGITDQNGVTTTNARRHQNSSALQEFNNAGTSVFSATAAFSGESVVLSPAVNTSSAFGQGGWLCIGS